MIHMQIDEEISEVKEERQVDLNEEKQMVPKKNTQQSQRSRIQAMNSSQMTVQSPSRLIDNTLGRIEEMRAPSRVQGGEKEEGSPTKKKTKKRVKGVRMEEKPELTPVVLDKESVNL